MEPIREIDLSMRHHRRHRSTVVRCRAVLPGAHHTAPAGDRPRSTPAMILALLVSSAALGATSCTSKPEPEPVRPWGEHLATTQQSSERLISAPVRPTYVVTGRLPLVYLAPSTITIAAVDLTTGAELGRATLGTRQIARIDAKHGFIVNDIAIHSGALPDEHQYGFSVLPPADSPNSMRTERIGPANPGAGGTRSGGQP